MARVPCVIKFTIMKLLLTSLLFGLASMAHAQPYSIHLEPVTISNFGGVQSFAIGKSNGKWLIIGGRLDGLHQRQPFASFDAAGHNNQLVVIDPAQGISWSAPLSSLSSSLQMQLKSTNMEFTQVDSMLYLVGGYGMDANGSHVTFQNLTAVNVPRVIDAVVNGTSFTAHFRQISDLNFKVTGGQLYQIHNVFYLVGGQLFDGRYNPHGPTHGPGFTQQYTDAVRRFTLVDDGTNLNVQFLSEYQDATLLHKRDYNAVPVISNGESSILALSGVFQPLVDLPWLNAVHIDTSGFAEVAGFTQYYNHYHSAKAALYDSVNDVMHYYLFGGIAQYYLQNGTRIQDNNVPFVKTIAHLSRDTNGQLTETALLSEMPDYLGAGAEFIPLESLPHFENEIIDFSSISGDSIWIGYIVGGIKSTAPNIFFVNTGVESEATSSVYKVYLVKSSIGIPEGERVERALIRPNPTTDQIQIDLSEGTVIERIEWLDLAGKTIRSQSEVERTDSLILQVEDLPRGEYILRIHFEDHSYEGYRLALY